MQNLRCQGHTQSPNDAAEDKAEKYCISQHPAEFVPGLEACTSRTNPRSYYYSFSFALILQIICVMVPIGQKLHQVLGLHRAFTTKPMIVDVSINE